jgi:eukaryotic-like serine/threonine-protein kinase
LYEMLAGEPPFKGPTPQMTLMLRLMQPPRPLRPVVNVPPVVEAAILQALAKDPAQRYEHAGQFAAALEGRFPPPAAPAPPPPPRPSPPAEPRRPFVARVLDRLLRRSGD